MSGFKLRFTQTTGRPDSRIALMGAVISFLALLAAIVSGLGHRWGVWHFTVGFTIIRWALYGALLSLPVSILGAFVSRPGHGRRGFPLAVLGFLIALGVIVVPLRLMHRAKTVPPINDITTDTENPPAFVAILPLRSDAPTPAEYGGPEVASQQLGAYPELRPTFLSVTPNKAFEFSLDIVKKLKWELAAAEPGEGRIEATDTTFLYGFKDDVVIRITPHNSGSRVDVRSVSRVGKSDMGKNARRITEFIDALKKRVSNTPVKE
jgi:uncharacterized protein (DUF1499 family)